MANGSFALCVCVYVYDMQTPRNILHCLLGSLYAQNDVTSLKCKNLLYLRTHTYKQTFGFPFKWIWYNGLLYSLITALSEERSIGCGPWCATRVHQWILLQKRDVHHFYSAGYRNHKCANTQGSWPHSAVSHSLLVWSRSVQAFRYSLFSVSFHQANKSAPGTLTRRCTLKHTHHHWQSLFFAHTTTIIIYCESG